MPKEGEEDNPRLGWEKAWNCHAKKEVEHAWPKQDEQPASWKLEEENDQKEEGNNKSSHLKKEYASYDGRSHGRGHMYFQMNTSL